MSLPIAMIQIKLSRCLLLSQALCDAHHLQNTCTGAHEATALEKFTEVHSVSCDQLDFEIEDSDIIYLARYFDNVEYYFSVLGLTSAEQTDITLKKVSEGTQLAMNHCLLVWKRHNPSKATLRTLLEILLSLKKEEIASNVCKYFCPKRK